jgi:hypothetical protein
VTVRPAGGLPQFRNAGDILACDSGRSTLQSDKVPSLIRLEFTVSSIAMARSEYGSSEMSGQTCWTSTRIRECQRDEVRARESPVPSVKGTCRSVGEGCVYLYEVFGRIGRDLRLGGFVTLQRAGVVLERVF